MPNQKPMTIDESVTAFLRTLSGANKSPATITAYRTDLAQFARFLAETNCTVAAPADVTRADVSEFLGHLADRRLSGVTRARKLAALREWFRYLEGEGLIAKNPTVGVETPKKECGSRTALRSDEYTKLLSLAGANPRDYTILQVFLQTGIRVGELCALTREDVDLEQRLLRVMGKGQKTRTIELEKRGIQAIKSYLAVRPESLHDELFLNYQGEPLGGARRAQDGRQVPEGLRHHQEDQPALAAAHLRHLQGGAWRQSLCAAGMAGTRPAGHDPELRPHGQGDHQKGNGGDKSMKHYRLSRPPRSLRRSAVHLDNVALVPASLLPFKTHWQQIANGLSQGDVLIVLPYQAKQQRVAFSVASHFRAKGKHVKVMGSVAI